MEDNIAYSNIKLDKSKWKLVKFGDVVVEPKETCKDIYTEGIVHVVGLEHIDTGDIHLRKSATTEETTTFSKKFRKGDVLFGRRRAYLKKAALAYFDGICSGDITVFRAKDQLAPDLLPFIVNNDKFFDYAVKHSAGGLSPRVKFKDLANYEFLLPPKAEQARLAELLWAMDEVIEKEKVLYLKFTQYKNSLVDEFLTGKRRSAGFTKTLHKFSLVEIANFRRGSFPQPYGLPQWYDEENGYPFVQVYDINYNLKLKSNTKVKISKEAIGFSVFVPKGTLIISIQGSIGRVAITQYDAYVDRTILIFTKYLKETNVIFFSYVLQKLFYEKEKSARGAVIKTITKEELSKFIIPFPDIKEQEKIANEFEELERRNIVINNKISASQSLQKSLINQIF
jgi:type I restriction enzyme S subunit